VLLLALICGADQKRHAEEVQQLGLQRQLAVTGHHNLGVGA